MKKCDFNSPYLIAVCIFFGCLARLLPHPPNVTPFISLSLFIGIYCSFYRASFSMLFCAILSDLFLSVLKGYPAFGGWSFFTYSFFILTVWLGSSKIGRKSNILICVPAASLGFWLWTNFSVWLFGGYYSKDISGLLTCYELALPFLRNGLLGDLLWMMIIFGLGAKLFHFKEDSFYFSPKKGFTWVPKTTQVITGD